MNQLSKDGVQVVKQVLADHEVRLQTAPMFAAMPPSVQTEALCQQLYTAILELPGMRAIKLAADSNADALGDAMDENKRLREALEKIAKMPDLPNPERDADWKNCMKWAAYYAQQALNPVVAGGEQQSVTDAIKDHELQKARRILRTHLSAANQQVDNALGGFEERRHHQQEPQLGQYSRFDGVNRSAAFDERAQSHDLSQTKEAE